MLGLDSRSAMTDGGATTGFGNLAAALIMAPRMKHQQDEEAKKLAEEQAFRKQQLAQALEIAQMNDRNDRARIHDDWQNRQDELTRRTNDDTYNHGLKTAESIGHGAMNLMDALGMSAQPSKAAGAPKVATFNPYKHTKTPDGGEHDELKSADEIDQERARNDRYLRGAVNGVSTPKDSPSIVAERQARNAEVQRQQRQQGLAQGPGDKKPAPSTAGAGPVLAATPDAPAPAVASNGKVLKTSRVRQMVGTDYPDLASAIEHAKSLGYTVVRDD